MFIGVHGNQLKNEIKVCRSTQEPIIHVVNAPTKEKMSKEKQITAQEVEEKKDPNKNDSSSSQIYVLTK